jgi:hypothetical protein
MTSFSIHHTGGFYFIFSLLSKFVKKKHKEKKLDFQLLFTGFFPFSFSFPENFHLGTTFSAED